MKPSENTKIFRFYCTAPFKYHLLYALLSQANGIFDDIDGTLGLVKAFKLAGVNTIIASLSKVDDQATSQFMSHFYLRLSRGESLHAAFINAINHMKTRYPDQPKFWAMFKMIDCREP